MKIISNIVTMPDCQEAGRLLNNLREYGAKCISKYKYDNVPTILFSSDPDTSDYDMICYALEAEGYTELTSYGSDPYVTEYLSSDKSICAKLIQNQPNDIRLEVSNEPIEGSESINFSEDDTSHSTVAFESTNDFIGRDMTKSLCRQLDQSGVDYASVRVDDDVYTVNLSCKSAQHMHVAKLCIENCGFFKRWVDLPNNHKDSVLSSIYTDDEDDSPYQYLESKQVLDSDGFYTDYTLYLNTDTGNYICMFGDNDVYEPDEDYADYVTDSKSTAYEWFENYHGFEDDEDDEDPLTLNMRYTDEELIQSIQHKLDISNKAAKIIYNWYDTEGEFDSQDDLVDTLDYIKNDIFDMLDAATDPNEKALVEAELNE